MLLKLIKGALAKTEPVPRPVAPVAAPVLASPFPHAPERSVVVICFGPSRSNPFVNLSKVFAEAYAERGLHCHVVDMLYADLRPLEAMFLSKQVRYGIAWGGIGSHMEVTIGDTKSNLWDFTDTPVFKLVGDHPGYFIDCNVSDFPTAVNLYGFDEHLDFFMRHLQTKGYGGITPLSQLDSLEPHELDFDAKRDGKIVFLKNGNSPEQLRQAWQARLPASMAKIVLELSEEVLASINTATPLEMESMVVRHFAGLGLDVAKRTQFLSFYIAQMDDYLRRVKSTMITEAVLDFPVEVHGEMWEHVDFTGRRATLVPFGDYDRSKQLIKDALAVIDMAPNTQRQPHERFLRCASRHTLCLTNRIAYLEKEYGALGQPLFDFTPDSIGQSVAAVLEDPARHVEIGRAVGAEFKRRHGPDDLVNFLEMMSDQIRVQQGPDPMVQPFLVWPPEKLDPRPRRLGIGQ